MQNQVALIVGQGLAGTLLSFRLKQRGISHLVIDQGIKTNATQAAAGLVNPITGRYFTKTWLFEKLLASLDPCYDELGELLDETFKKNIVIWRALNSIAQENQWAQRMSDPIYEGYFSHVGSIKNQLPYFSNDLPYVQINHARKVDIGLLMKKYRQHLSANSQLLEEPFNYDNLHWTNNSWHYKGNAYSVVFFAEGYQAIHNPFFNYLPFKPAKGEALITKTNVVEDIAIKNNLFLAKETNGHFWSGGGYDWVTEDPSPTTKFREDYKSKLEAWLNHDFEIVDHKAGIRPCVKDRKPFLGEHPEQKKLYIFNGLGTKGTSLGPYFSEQLVAHIFENTSITPEVDILRFS